MQSKRKRGAAWTSSSDPGTPERIGSFRSMARSVSRKGRRNMAVVRRTARAEDDLVDIWLYIAADNPDAADRLLEEIDRKCLLLAANPLLGRPRP